MEPIKSFGEKKKPGTLLTGFPTASSGKLGRSLPGRCRNLRIFWGPREEKNSSKSIGITGQSNSKSLAWLSGLERHLEVQSGDSLCKVLAKHI